MAIQEEFNVNTVGILWEYHGNAVGMMSMAFLGGSTVGILYERGVNIIIA